MCMKAVWMYGALSAMACRSFIDILRSCDKASKMAQARLLLLGMQSRYSSLRFNPTCHRAKAGDVVESVGGIVSPYRASVRVVIDYLADLFVLSHDALLETVEAMGELARQCKILYVHIWRVDKRRERGRASEKGFRYHV